MNLLIVVAVHKPCRLPPAPLHSPPIYLPIRVGAALGPPLGALQGDNTGENISAKNPHYCELTALYWAWKNLDTGYIGLAHYRRYFAVRRTGEKWARIAGAAALERALQKADLLLPQKRRYWIETNYSQYVHAHHKQDLDLTRQILARRCPQYLPAFDAVMRRTSGHRFNMFVMKRALLDRYCSWLFPLLFELEAQLDTSGYTPNDARVFGFVSERLLDVWVQANHVPYTELPVVFTERQNWLKKGGAFLLRKFRGRVIGFTE